MTDRPLHPETLAIRIQAPQSAAREHSVPLYLTSSFVFDSAEHARALFTDEVQGNIYSRYSNPNTDEFIQKLATLEGVEDGVATASGMAAVFTCLATFLGSGDHLLCSRAVFGSTHQILTRIFPRWGIESSYLPIGATPEAWAAAVRPNTKMVFVETPSNPSLDLIDLEWLGAFCRERGLLLVVDNCFATPFLQQPARYGAGLVIHSATKFIDGQGRGLGGAILGSRERIAEIRYFARHTGPAISPFNAWMLSKSLETLSIRMARHSSNALALGRHFEAHPEVERVRYPYLPSHPQHQLALRQMSAGGGILVLVLRGGLERARRFVDSVQLVSRTSNLGDTRTIATHPGSTTHSRVSEEEQLEVGITPGLIRLSVGLEHPDDIIADIEQALARSA